MVTNNQTLKFKVDSAKGEVDMYVDLKDIVNVFPIGLDHVCFLQIKDSPRHLKVIESYFKVLQRIFKAERKLEETIKHQALKDIEMNIKEANEVLSDYINLKELKREIFPVYICNSIFKKRVEIPKDLLEPFINEVISRCEKQMDELGINLGEHYKLEQQKCSEDKYPDSRGSSE